MLTCFGTETDENVVSVMASLWESESLVDLAVGAVPNYFVVIIHFIKLNNYTYVYLMCMCDFFGVLIAPWVHRQLPSAQ